MAEGWLSFLLIRLRTRSLRGVIITLLGFMFINPV